MTNPPNLDLKAKREILHRVLKALNDKFYQPAKLGASWQEAVERYRPEIDDSQTATAFEDAITRLLGELKTSHVGFFHAAARRASSRAALSATYLEDDTDRGARWIFQDVHGGGAAAQAQINPGDVLLRVAEKEIHPPEHPTFAMGDRTEITVLGGNGEMRMTSVNVARPKGKKLHFVEPKLVVGRRLDGGIGYLKVAMFPGMIGVEVANAISEEIHRLDGVDDLVIDLRGNTGGGIGALRIMSLLTPDSLPVGFALNRELAQRNIEETKARFPRFNRIPSSKRNLWLLAIRYAPSLLRKAPIVLETEGLGARSFHGNVVLLVDRHTASAAEMIVAFARENSLARIVGEKTAGRLLSATSVKVGAGYRLALPTGAYYTWKGTVLEGTPIEPDESVLFDWRAARRGDDTQLKHCIALLGRNRRGTGAGTQGGC
jgi:carboxyl-terminal processing protease